MAFDQNAIPKDLRPLNIVRAVTDDPRIATATSAGRPVEGFYVNPPRDGSPNSIVYYTPTASDTGYVGLGTLPVPAPAPAPAPAPVPISGVAAVAAWVPRVVTSPTVAVAATGVVNLGSGTLYGHSLGARSMGSPSDHTSDEAGDDSVSGRKVKFMCSFGGNIRPRPGDGALRYVGGQTRIISVRRGITFGEFVQKMIGIYGQSVVIKYQLPDEDLDALVSVSCPDDLDNMMDEYEKMLERSSDGSAKLRIFLFSFSEADSASMVHIGDWHDNAQKYVEAVNGLTDGSGRDIIDRKESNASAASTQSSDINPNEVAEGRGVGEITSPGAVGVLSPRENPTASQETTTRNSCGDQSPVVHVEASAVPSGVPTSNSSTVQSGIPVSNFGRTPVSLLTENEFEKSAPVNVQQERVVELQHPGAAYPTPSPYWYAYGDPQPETLNCSDFVQTPSQMAFPASLMRTVAPVFTQQEINATGTGHQQFLHMTMVPSSHVSSNPNMVQSQQFLLEPYPGESPMGQRVVHVPADQGYHAYHAQVPHAMMGGAYGWQQIPQAELMAFSEGFMPHQQVVAPEEFLRVDDCYMCQKALPHAHSDTIAQDNRESPSSNVPDLKPIYHSLQLDDKGRPVNKHFLAGAFSEPSVEQRGTGPQPIVVGNDSENLQLVGNRLPENAEVHYDMDRIIHQKAVNSELPRLPVPPNATGITGGTQPPYGIVVGTIPQNSSDGASLQTPTPTHYRLIQDSVVKKSQIADSPAIGGMPLQSADYVLHESPEGYSGNIPASVATEDTAKPTYDHIKQIGGRLENLWVSPPEVLAVTEPNKLPTDNSKREDILESRPQQVAGRETYLDAFNKPRVILGVNHSKLNEMPPSSLHEAPCMPNLQQAEYHEVAQPPPLVDAGMYGHSKLGVNLVPDEISHNPSSAVDSSHSSERIPPIIDWMDTFPVRQRNIVSSGGDVQSDASSSVSPSYMIEDLQESTNSLFSNQDPWNLRTKNHFPPPRPSKIQLLKKESFGTRDAPGETPFDNVEFLLGNNNGLVTDDRVSSAYANFDASSEHSQPSKGSFEELIKQELQAVAEGVAASVLQTPATSNAGHVRNDETSMSFQNNDVNIIDKEVNTDIFEEVKARVPEKINLGFPVADGRLQIIKNSDLEEIKELGSGTFGTVYYGKWRGTDVAIKRINDRCFAGKPSEVQRMRDDFWNEANILADLHHPNVVAFYGVVLDGPGGSFATVTEYMVNGSLRTALQKSERNLDKRKRVLIAMDVAFGMEYLHGKKIVHFDLKSDNLLVNLRDPHRPICKVGDLGLSKVKCQTLISGGVRGTLPWMAPELLNGSSNLVTEKVDVYSFGIVMWELLTGEEPYADLHYGAIIGGIVSNTLRPPVPESCDADWRSLMERCWAAEPSERPSFPEVANELRSLASKIPPKGQQQVASKQSQVKS